MIRSTTTRGEDVVRFSWRPRRDAALRSRVRTELRELGLGAPLDLDELCRRYGQRRGRPLTTRAEPLPVPGPFGLWIAHEDHDVVYYQSATTPTHQRLIVLHEIGHIMADHAGDRGEPHDGAGADDVLADLSALVPDLSTDMVRSVLQREAYDDEHEREAELVGSIILEWADRISVVAPRSAAGSARRAQDALGEHTGWL